VASSGAEAQREFVAVLKGVSHAYDFGTMVLRDIDLRVARGERVAIVGPSGAGKSTLMRMLNGLLTPTAGEVRILGEPVSSMPESGRRLLRRRVGMVFQEFALVERLTVLLNVLIGRLGYVAEVPSLLRMFPQDDVLKARAALQEVGLGALENRLVRNLSGGQKQRVAIARAIAQEPEVILADEPTANLDVRTADEVLKLLVETGVRHGTTLILNLHDVRAARKYCERIVGVRGGMVVWDGAANAFDDEVVEKVFYSDDTAVEGMTRPSSKAAP